MCAGETGPCEMLALACGLLAICEVEGLTRPLIFFCAGQPARLYLPKGCSGPWRDNAICAAYSGLVGLVLSPAVRAANWRRVVGQLVGETPVLVEAAD